MSYDVKDAVDAATGIGLRALEQRKYNSIQELFRLIATEACRELLERIDPPDDPHWSDTLSISKDYWNELLDEARATPRSRDKPPVIVGKHVTVRNTVSGALFKIETFGAERVKLVSVFGRVTVYVSHETIQREYERV